MQSLLGQEFRARSFLYRVIVAAIILAITLVVSYIWQRMVYTIPVLAVLLFLAAGLPGILGGGTRRNVDEDSQESIDIDVDVGSGLSPAFCNLLRGVSARNLSLPL